PVEDQLSDLFLEEGRFTEVPTQELPEPDEELLRNGSVEAQSGANLGHLLGRGIVTGNDGGRIARGEAQQEEDKERHNGHHGDGGEATGGQCRRTRISGPSSRRSRTRSLALVSSHRRS